MKGVMSVGTEMEKTEFQKRIIGLREQTGLNRKEFCEKYEIPYRTMTDWELGNRTAPDYVMRLLAYYIRMEVEHFMDFRIRPVKQGDAFMLATIQTNSWKAAFKGIISDADLERCTDIDKATAMYSRLLDEKKGNGYIGEVNGKAHCIAWWDKARDNEMPDYAEIICIHSLPDNWRKGYGSKMMDRLLSDISEAGFQKVMLWVFAENKRARAFYEAKGFAPTDRVQEALGTTEICYVREL